MTETIPLSFLLPSVFATNSAIATVRSPFKTMAKKNKQKATQLSVPMVDEEEDERKEGNELKKSKFDLKIEAVKGSPYKVSPIIGYFPTGFDPLKGRNHEDDGQEPNPEPRVRVLKNVKRTNRLQLVVSPNESPVNFVGTNYSGEAAMAQMCTYALGVLDKTTQTLKIVQIEANKIFRLEPKVGESLLPDNAASDSVKEETAEEKANKLLKYTTSKTIRKAKRLDALRRHQDPEFQENLDKKLEGIKINKEALEVAETTTINARNIPAHDMSIDNVAMVYPIHKMIFSGEWDYLYDIVELLQAGKEVKPESYPIFVCNRVHILDDMKDEDAKSNLAGIFSYISHLIKFKDKNSMDGFSSAKNHKFPSILSQKFNTMFADSEAKRLADDKRDLLISYVLVLTLIADKFKTDPTDIAKDLRMNSIALRPHFEYIGCSFKREGNVLLAELKAPLKFPTIRVKRRR